MGKLFYTFFIFLVFSYSCNADYHKMIIGYSINGFPVDLYKFGNGDEYIVIIAGVHGDEKNSTTTAFYLINKLTNNSIIIPKSKTILIVPEANPDGLLAGSRFNSRDIDINRNFDTSGWQKTALYHGKAIKCGEQPFSEAESINIKKIIDTLAYYKKTAILVTLHSQANAIIPPNDADFNTLFVNYLREISKYKRPIYYPTYGDMEKWVSEKYLIPAATIEFKTKTDPDNLECEEILISLLTINLYEQFYKNTSAEKFGTAKSLFIHNNLNPKIIGK